ncbi:uncharacterized protein FIBRA_06544 [Fibroporia radiculosa]|uniref:Uncharacterized protein n=1 Tax=Fibroporia radiculosa TaxID=599839 RepID=J4IBB5_9APHY|nr:uncharacterized protein FIBRA_06544 [Fibroporia radiculosa]CCM04371.1 predicted protein [Fibroporia radiculosa]
MLESRVEVDPTQLVYLADVAIKGKHKGPAFPHKGAADYDFDDDDEVPDFLVGSSQDNAQGATTASESFERHGCLASSVNHEPGAPWARRRFEAAEEAKQARKRSGENVRKPRLMTESPTVTPRRARQFDQRVIAHADQDETTSSRTGMRAYVLDQARRLVTPQ